jgi:hypothetical protein
MELYQSKSHALYISVLGLASSIRQQDSSVDAFYRQLIDVWHQLDSLAPAYCRSCDCCRLRQEHDGVLRLHEFLRRLRTEFEQLRAQLLARPPLPTMVEAVTLARVEEIRLRGVLSSSATVLATTTGSTTSTPAPVLSSTPSSAPAPASGPVTQGGMTAALFCHRLVSSTSTVRYSATLDP